jgi:predicted nucleic acid-binding protein
MISPVIDDDFTVLIDTNVLVQDFLRDLLFNLAEKGVFTLRLSEGILGEADRVLRQESSNRRPESVHWLLSQIRLHFADAIVAGYESIRVECDLPDEGDRHVIQAAIKARSHQIITYNKKHFPLSALALFDLEAVKPDLLLESAFNLYPEVCRNVVRRWLAHNRRPPQNMRQFRQALANYRLRRAAERTLSWPEF